MSGKTKNIVIGLVIAVLIVVIAVILFLFGNNKISAETDGMKFKHEYESLNGAKAYGDNVYQTMDIDENNKIKYTDLQGAVEFLESGTGLIYFGFPNCPWCRGMLPTLLETVGKSSLDQLLYVDMTDKRDTYAVKDKKAVKTKDASEEYYKLLELLDEYLDIYTVTEEREDGEDIAYDTGEKRMYVPLVVAVKDGVIKEAVTNPIKLDKGQTAYDAITTKQREDLRKLFEDMLDEATASVCDEHC